MRCGNTVYDNGIRAAVVHHTAGSNDYAPQDSAGIVRSIYEYHTRTLGWCDIAYNALVDKYGQVFEGRAGGMDKPVEGSHTGGFNRNTWGVAMIGDFDVVPADTDPVAHHRPTARLAARARPRRSTGHGRTALGGRVVHQVPDVAPRRRCRRSSPTATSATPTARATPPTRRWTRSATSRRGSTTRPARGPGRLAARRRDLRQVGVDGRNEQPARRAHLAGGLWRRGRRALRHLRQGRGVLVTGERRRARHRRDLQGVGHRWASSAARSACPPAARSRSRSGSCRTSSTAR